MKKTLATWIETAILYFGLFFCGAITGASLLIYDQIGKACTNRELQALLRRFQFQIGVLVALILHTIPVASFVERIFES